MLFKIGIILAFFTGALLAYLSHRKDMQLQKQLDDVFDEFNKNFDKLKETLDRIEKIEFIKKEEK